MSNVLYCGDNLECMREFVPDDSIDLVYLDPPFNSQRIYNVVYKDSRAQEEAFKDYWAWEDAASTYVQYVTHGAAPLRVRSILKTLHETLIDEDSDLLAYLTMMAPRLVEIHRVLKSTGSMYLHCDPTASHYLKVILDAIFGSERFQNEIIWQRTNRHNDPNRWASLHDVILYYAKSGSGRAFTPLRVSSTTKLPHTLITGADGLKYQTYELTAPHVSRGKNGETWRGFNPTKFGRMWANAPSVMDQWDADGLIHWPKKKGGWPRRRDLTPFIVEERTVIVGDVWTDIDRLNQTAKERVGYPTQKPVTLLTRILEASSQPGAIVLDPFCGCGTTIVACEQTGRRWIGIDIARKAVDVLEARFAAHDPPLPEPSIIWHPADPDAALALAERDPDQFEAWVRRKLRATKRPHDRGIDGECFYDDTENHRRWHVIIQVKAGSVTSGDVRDLGGTIERERRKARVDPGRGPIGVLVSTKLPTKEMRLEATLTEFLDVADDEGPIPRLQFLSVDDLFLPRIPIRILGKNNAQRPAPALPSRGQTAIVFPAKVRPAQEAKTKAKADAQAIRLFAEDQPTTKAASLDVEAEKPAKRPSSKPYGVPESPQQTVAEKGSKPPKK